jgi:hypothetical protein
MLGGGILTVLRHTGRVNAVTPKPRSSAPMPVETPAWAEVLTVYLDRAFVIPGTNIRIGIDPILGLLAPGAGDAVGAIASFAVFYLGFRMRVPKVVLLRMLLNIAVDALLGALPVLGDVFDVFFRAADRNLNLVKKYAGSARRADFGDYAIVGLGLSVVLGLCLLPVVLGLGLLYVLTSFHGA